MSQTFSTGDVAAHNKGTDLYIIVDSDVYDLTKFQDEHPGMRASRLHAVPRALADMDHEQVERRVCLSRGRPMPLPTTPTPF